MSKEEIALQLTLKSIERMATPTNSESAGKSSSYNETFSDNVVNFYNNIFKKINLSQTIDV